jgi:pimeloyl-ACP methyl ester carboxylesterase
MPSITVDRLQVAYQEVNAGSDKTIFFIHGNSGSSRSWAKQLGDAQLKDYRMIAFDLPAHGDSSGSDDPDTDYSLPGLGRTMASAVGALVGDKPYAVVGFSLGSNVLAEALPSLKPSGLVLTDPSVAGGGYTMDKVFQPGAEASVLFSDTATPESIAAFASIVGYNPSDADKRVTIDDYNRVKPGFRPTLMRTVMAGQLSDEPQLLVDAGLPVLVIFGREDRLVQTGYLDDAPFQLWKGRTFQLPSAGHTSHVDQPALWGQLLAEYMVRL